MAAGLALETWPKPTRHFLRRPVLPNKFGRLISIIGNAKKTAAHPDKIKADATDQSTLESGIMRQIKDTILDWGNNNSDSGVEQQQRQVPTTPDQVSRLIPTAHDSSNWEDSSTSLFIPRALSDGLSLLHTLVFYILCLIALRRPYKTAFVPAPLSPISTVAAAQAPKDSTGSGASRRRFRVREGRQDAVESKANVPLTQHKYLSSNKKQFRTTTDAPTV